MSPYTWKYDVCLTGMITIFIRFRQQSIHLIPLKFASKLEKLLNEIDENGPFGRNIQAVNSPPITIYDGFLQPRMP